MRAPSHIQAIYLQLRSALPFEQFCKRADKRVHCGLNHCRVLLAGVNQSQNQAFEIVGPHRTRLLNMQKQPLFTRMCLTIVRKHNIECTG